MDDSIPGTGTHLVEVYIQDDCPDCRQVVKMLHDLQNTLDYRLRVHGKEGAGSQVLDREIFVFPATFVDKRLVFYGRFHRSAIAKYLAVPSSDLNGSN